MVQQGRGAFRAALAAAQRLRTVGHEQGLRLYEALGTTTQGSVWVQEGELDRGLTLLTTGLAHYCRLGNQASLTFFLSCLAEAHRRRGQVAEGLAVIGEAIQLTETHFAHFWTAELYRLQGELLLAQAGQGCPATAPEVATAEACFQQALAIARQQGAKALELRAALSLSRLWRAQDNHAAAQGLVAGCYNGFSEGWDTADLQAAHEVLAHGHPVT